MDQFIYGFLENLPTLALVAVIFASLYILGKGADYLVDQAIALSIMWRIPEAVIGATVVSLGTTIPEVTVSLMAAMEGSPGMALGNAIGSIITNTTLILGLAALSGVLLVDKKMMEKQGRTLLASVILLTIFSLPILRKTGVGLVSQQMGLLFLLILLVYIVRSIKTAKGEDSSQGEEDLEGSIFSQLLKLLLGVVVVIISSKVLIPSVEITALRIGIPESIIAATLVAFGTSVPELITSITAVRKGHGELAIGNVVGANILNVLFVIGLSAAVSQGGLEVPSLYFSLQIPAMVISVVLLQLISKNKEHRLNKFHGGLLLGTYLVYLGLNYLGL